MKLNLFLSGCNRRRIALRRRIILMPDKATILFILPRVVRFGLDRDVDLQTKMRIKAAVLELVKADNIEFDLPSPG